MDSRQKTNKKNLIDFKQLVFVQKRYNNTNT